MMLFTLIEPHAGLHRAYNRWYERDHFYSGVMTLPGTLSGARWVATPTLKARRRPARSPIVSDPTRGSFLTTYYVDAERMTEWDVAASDAVRALGEAGRLWPERDHVLTRFVDFAHAVYRDDDPVPAVQTLDHRYPGLVCLVGRGPDRAPRHDVLAHFRDDLVPGLIAGTPVASVCTFTMRPFTGERPPDLPVDRDPENRFLALWFVEATPEAVWTEVFDPVAERFSTDPGLDLEWMGGFVPTAPGTDAHVDLLEAAEAGRPVAPTTPRAVVEEYFRRVRSRDPRLTELFADDARLVGLGSVTEGRAGIDAFYGEVNATAAPVPALRGPLLVDGNRVAAEIDISVSGGPPVHVVDLFEVIDGRIRTLTYFLAQY
jgi:hypothetical protein